MSAPPATSSRTSPSCPLKAAWHNAVSLLLFFTLILFFCRLAAAHPLMPSQAAWYAPSLYIVLQIDVCSSVVCSRTTARAPLSAAHESSVWPDSLSFQSTIDFIAPTSSFNHFSYPIFNRPLLEPHCWEILSSQWTLATFQPRRQCIGYSDLWKRSRNKVASWIASSTDFS